MLLSGAVEGFAAAWQGPCSTGGAAAAHVGIIASRAAAAVRRAASAPAAEGARGLRFMPRCHTYFAVEPDTPT